uniref:Uncharacterized protein n=1 Tax=Rhizophora mucronata TaxID=61149 RepID=A0A2P2QX27_RHIMU
MEAFIKRGKKRFTGMNLFYLWYCAWILVWMVEALWGVCDECFIICSGLSR